MSFLLEQKKEIMSAQYKSCCRYALLYGILFSKAKINDDKIYLNLEGKEVIDYTCELIKELFMKEASVSSSNLGGRCRTLSFSSPAAIRYLSSISDEKSYFINKCPMCKSSFSRGIFLACGRITDPKKQYRLEFAPSGRIDLLYDYFVSDSLTFSKTVRRSENIIYTQNSSIIEDFFACMGLNSTTFILINSKIESEFKNTANRIRNCETNNIDKTISASLKWVNAIEALERANLLSTLPEELELTARMRLQYKDYSLARLAAEFSPPISKPGLSHRLNKILEISDNLLKK